LIAANPCRIRGCGSARRVKQIKPASLAELEALVSAMPERYQCGMVRTTSGRQVKGPKSDAGRLDVAIPPHLLPAVTDHLKRHAQAGAQGLLFPAGHGGHPDAVHAVPGVLSGP
jgi:hypothetical protein